MENEECALRRQLLELRPFQPPASSDPGPGGNEDEGVDSNDEGAGEGEGQQGQGLLPLNASQIAPLELGPWRQHGFKPLKRAVAGATLTRVSVSGRGWGKGRMGQNNEAARSVSSHASVPVGGVLGGVPCPAAMHVNGPTTSCPCQLPSQRTRKRALKACP